MAILAQQLLIWDKLALVQNHDSFGGFQLNHSARRWGMGSLAPLVSV